ncbi:MAG: HEAT repeat domain-containing protein [Planctomycetota bacterium]|jgi:hypothetical protein
MLRLATAPFGVILVLLSLAGCLSGPEENPEPLPELPPVEGPIDPLPEEKESPKFLSSWAQIVLTRAGLVAQGTITKVFGLPSGVLVASFRLDDILLGRGEKGSTILIGTTDPGFFSTGDTLIIVIGKESDGNRFQALDKIDVGAKGGKTRAKALRRFLAMEALEDDEERRVIFKKILFEHLASADRWCRENAIRELYIYTEKDPGAFSEKDRELMERESLARASKTTRNRLEYAVAHIEVIPPLRIAAYGPEDEREKAFGVLSSLIEETGVADRRIRFREDVIFQQYRAAAHPGLRAGIVRAASALKRPRLLTGVVKALEDRSPHVRVEALRGIRQYASPYSARRVADRLSDPIPRVRLEAVLTLGAVGTKRFIPSLEVLDQDDEEIPAIRKAARDAIEAIEAGG